jgi:uncharacterized membrane protein
VEFTSSSADPEATTGSTTIRMTISLDLPDYAARVVEAVGKTATGFIEETLLADLKRFRARILKEIREERMNSFREKVS